MKRKIISAFLCSVMIAGSVSGTGVHAEEKDWGTYEIIDDGYGNLTANFPEEYPMEMIQTEDEETIDAKVEALMKTLTLEEKIDMLSADGAVGTFTYGIERSYRTGYWKGCARVGIPIVAFYDGPMGIRMNAGYETTRPASENAIAATFDVDAAYDYGTIYGIENKYTSSNNQLGAQIDLVYDLTRNRAKDMFGEDWYLSGSISAASTKGMQDQNTQATLKHLIGVGDVDEQTLHETYLSVFEENFREGEASAVMTNYEITNGISACMDNYINKTVLRYMWNYDGLVMTDWGGNYEFTVDNGVTMETPSGTYNNYDNVMAALESGEITEEDINTAVRYNLKALGEIGYLGMVAISKDGTAAVDPDAPEMIELPDIVKGEERLAMLQENNEMAIETAQQGAVLVRNEQETLPLKEDESVALIGLGSTYLVAGSHGENAFGWLEQLSVSPYDALSEAMPNTDIAAYVAQDIVGEAIPGEYLYQDKEAAQNGVLRTGHDGYGAEVECVDENIDFVTNSTDYFNAEDGTAFEYGENGAAYTFTTYLKAPETGTYSLKIEGLFANSISGQIELEEETKDIVAAAGSAGTGFVATSGLVTTDTGLDIPSESQQSGFNPFGGGPEEEDTATEAEATEESQDETEEETEDEMNAFWASMQQDPTYEYFELEEGKTYKITVSFDAALEEERQYLAGTKDTQIRLAWITPSMKEQNYTSAVDAAKTADTSIVFLSMLQSLEVEEEQMKLLNDVIANAKANDHKVAVVITDGLLPDISSFVEDVDAVLMVWQPGQGGGTVISNLLTGAYNPSGKLPLTWPADYEATNAELHEEGRTAETGLMGGSTSITLKEGIFVGYKWYDAADKDEAVLYDFGYGLSYTDFAYELVDVAERAEGQDEYGFDVTVKVTNTGEVAGSAVLQLYIKGAEVENGLYSPYEVAESWHYVDEDGDGTEDYFPEIDGVQIAELQLAGYAHTQELMPGESTEVTIHVDQRTFSYWDTSLSDEEMYERADGTRDKYTVITGEHTMYLAEASDDLTEEFSVVIE